MELGDFAVGGRSEVLVAGKALKDTKGEVDVYSARASYNIEDSRFRNFGRTAAKVIDGGLLYSIKEDPTITLVGGRELKSYFKGMDGRDRKMARSALLKIAETNINKHPDFIPINGVDRYGDGNNNAIAVSVEPWYLMERRTEFLEALEEATGEPITWLQVKSYNPHATIASLRHGYDVSTRTLDKINELRPPVIKLPKLLIDFFPRR